MTGMDRLTAMKIFVHVVETGSFSAASERMGLSRAAVSQYVSQLESHLGGRLLNRTTRRVSTTESGRLYFERCKEILSHLAEADGAVSGLTQQPRGTLRISVPTNFAPRHLVPLVSQFTQTYPEVKVDMTSSNRHVDLVDEGYDLAIRISNMTDSELVAQRLTRCRHVIFASPDYLAKHNTPTTPDDLLHHDCLLYAHTAGAIWPFHKNGSDHSVKVPHVFKSNDPDILLQAAVAGMGVCMMPTFIVCDEIRSGALKMILEEYETLEMQVYAVYPSRNFLPAKTRLFVDFLRKRITDPPYWDHMLTVRSGTV